MHFWNIIEANRVHITVYRICNISYQALPLLWCQKACSLHRVSLIFGKASVLPHWIQVNVTNAFPGLEDIFTIWFPFDSCSLLQFWHVSISSQDFSLHEACCEAMWHVVAEHHIRVFMLTRELLGMIPGQLFRIQTRWHWALQWCRAKFFQKICTKKVFCPNLLYLSKFFPPPMLNYWFMHRFQKKWEGLLKSRFSFLLYSYIGKSSVMLHKTNSSFCWWHIEEDMFTHRHACVHTHTHISILQKIKLAS